MMSIESIEFSVFSPEEIRNMSAAKITVPDTYDEDGYPIQNGLADQRLGVIDPGLKCRTCGNRMKDCPGHFGHVELVRPVIHAGFGKLIYHLLKGTCRKCGRIINEKNTVKKIYAAKKCPYCDEEQQKIKFIKPTTFMEDKRKLLPNEVRERLERVTDADLRQMGAHLRPENLVLTALIVAPVTVRPSITLETGERSEDDLTHKLVDILRINQRLEENINAGAPQLIIEDLWELLQYHVTTYFDNETTGIPPARHRSGRQLKTLFQRLKGKEGRFRYNLSGKRVNFSARTVISPDPCLSINQIGVPQDIANELTLPVSVTAWNLEKMKEFIRLHPDKINYIIRADNRRKKLTAANTDEVVEELSPGYRIERTMMDGDRVIFNRQPSLHRISMMCHTVKVLPGKTFRFNICDCPPYGADFDGDEMNIHFPQNEEAQTEAETLMQVQDQILSPRHGQPIIQLELDQITGIYLLTQPEVIIQKDDACDILSAAGIVKAVGKKKLTGRETYSYLLPEKLDLEAKNNQGEQVVIKNGVLKEGTVDNKVGRKIIKKIFSELGADAAREYIDGASKASTRFMTKYGFTLGLDEYDIPDAARKEINGLYEQGRKELNELIQDLAKGKLKQLPGKTTRETFEEKAMTLLENVRRLTWGIVKKHLNATPVNIAGHPINQNSAILMADSGGKGRPTNVVQMCGLVGQQAVRGKRPASGYRKRLLPHFRQMDLGDEARGFVHNNYMGGLNPFEYFFHAAGGRDAVVDKGVNPAKTGYMQRRLVNALLDLVVDKDNSVRDADGNLVQTCYNNGLDPCDNKPVAYGEPVGVVAAQSVGEPGTQMTLRTFHYAGIASLAQLGFTRLVEIVDARKTPKNPVMEIHLKNNYRDWDSAAKIAASIEEVTLEKVARIDENFDKKVVVIEFNKTKLRERGLTEHQVEEHIKQVHPQYNKDGATITIRSKKDTLKNIRQMTTKLRELHLKGIQGIRKAILVKDPETKEVSIATDGSNLEAVFKMDEVDASQTSTNDVMEVARTLGIQAARNSIILEIKKVLDAQDLNVDPAHLTLIADAMTFNGLVQSVGRHGLVGSKKSILARASFEETSKHLINACIENATDNLNGMAENIIVGQTIPCGTGKVYLTMKLD